MYTHAGIQSQNSIMLTVLSLPPSLSPPSPSQTELAETRTQHWMKGTNPRPQTPPIRPPPYIGRGTSPRIMAHETLHEMRSPLPPHITNSASSITSVQVARFDDRAPVPPPRTKRKRKHASKPN